MSKETITHIGTVISVGNGTAKVLVQNRSACGSCIAKSTCGMTESVMKEISVKTDVNDLKAGDSVMVEVSLKRGFLAVILAYGFPALLLLLILIFGEVYGLKEELSAIAAIVSLIPYFFILYLFRYKIGKKIDFKISKR